MIKISIFLDDKIVGARSWYGVPRKGDVVEIQTVDPKAAQFVTVHQVRWLKGVEPGDCRVDLYCKR